MRNKKRDNRSLGHKNAVVRNRDRREEELTAALAKYNLPLRSNSVMCESYIKSERGINGVGYARDC